MSEVKIKVSAVQRAYNDVMDYIEKNGRTLQEEFELIQQKQSNLSRRLRDFVEFMIEVEKHAPEKSLEESILKNEQETQSQQN